MLIKRNLISLKVNKPPLSNRTIVKDIKATTKTDENKTSTKIKVIQSEKFSETNKDHNSCPMC